MEPSPMSQVRLQQIARLPLDQRAALIAQLFAEGAQPETPPAPPRRAQSGLRWRDLVFWARPDRLPLALTALATFALRKYFHTLPAPHPRADGFCGVAPIPDATAALDLYAQGFCVDAFPGLAALWSPPRRAIIRTAAARLTGAGEPSDGILFDRDFERQLDLCESQPSGAGRRPAFRAALCELYAHGLAHALELRDDEETTAAIVGVAIGGVFTVEAFFARDRAALAQAVAALAQHLAGLNFAAVDFRTPSPQLFGLPIELVSREAFLALLAQPGGARPGRWRRTEPAPAAEPEQQQQVA